MKKIIVGSWNDRVYCKCGELMKPIIMKNIIDYRCPRMKFYNFWKHKFPIAFLRIYK